MEYKIVKTMSWVGLEKAVNQLMEEGWVPQGGPIEEESGYCVQAMLKSGLATGENKNSVINTDKKFEKNP